ncbi:polysaccharide deacetylase family protein [Rhodopirellula sp.]|nr:MULTISPECIES: polysaccharide deacetylase family protein [Pirellulaceae]MDB4339014.1 polysaccharide deacetylase family protein [Rubripirellula sp.]MDB4678842.1 polysaccharide deacetylase family protein [Rhodopirellula sp.]
MYKLLNRSSTFGGCLLTLCLWFVFPGSNLIAQSQQSDSANKNQVDSRQQPIAVLTFDDASRSHFTIVRPILLKYGFGATFFITEGWDFASNKKDYMTWDEIKQLDQDGFEIGNHTKDHLAITDNAVDRLDEQLEGIEVKCRQYKIPKPVTFAWPGNAMTPLAFETLRKHGILFARRGGGPEYPYEGGRGFAYEPGIDHPFLLPSAGDARPDWTIENFTEAADKASEGRVAIMQFHGVPDTAHGWVSSSVTKFDSYMRYLALKRFKVIALRDLGTMVKAKPVPEDPMRVIRERKIELSK